MPPKVTILLPVHDGELYLSEAMDSLLSQTERDFELLAIDDGSTDRTPELLASYRERDPRVRVHTHATNRGLIATLNEGLELAEGKFLARLDADDIALPQRLERQVAFLEAHPEIAVVGSDARNFGTGTHAWRLPCAPAAIRARLLFECSLVHSSVMLRPEWLRQQGLRYDPAYPHAEDFALWAAIAQRAPVANLPERLIRYRVHGQSVSHLRRAEQAHSARRVRAGQLAALGVAFGESDLDLHDAIATGVFPASADFLDRAERWLRHLLPFGARLGPGGDGALTREAGARWGRVCRRSRRLGLLALRRFLSSPLHDGTPAITAAEVVLGAVAGALRPRGRA